MSLATPVLEATSTRTNTSQEETTQTAFLERTPTTVHSVVTVDQSSTQTAQAASADCQSFLYGHSTRTQQFACLYTKHKTQKRKIWNDGRLVVSSSNGFASARLHDAHPPAGSGDPLLDKCQLTPSQGKNLQQGVLLDMEKFLVTVEGRWDGTSSESLTGIRASATSAPSAGMQKLLSKKFQKPSRVRPPPPTLSAAAKLPPHVAKRRRPLQPGELQRQYYGTNMPTQGPSAMERNEGPLFMGRPMADSANDPTANHSFQEDRITNATEQQPGFNHGYQRHRTSSLPANASPRRQLPDQKEHSGSSYDVSRQRQTFKETASTDRALHQNLGPRQGMENVASHNNATSFGGTQSRKNFAKSMFVGDNGFDPSNFYGEDGEEEGEEEEYSDEEDQIVRSSTSEFALSTELVRPRDYGQRDTPSTLGRTDHRPNNGLHRAVVGIDSRGNENRAPPSEATLSTTDLLNLFGDSGASETPFDEEDAEAKSIYHNGTNITESTHVMDDDFVLPSQDSSSDEE